MRSDRWQDIYDRERIFTLSSLRRQYCDMGVDSDRVQIQYAGHFCGVSAGRISTTASGLFMLSSLRLRCCDIAVNSDRVRLQRAGRICGVTAGRISTTASGYSCCPHRDCHVVTLQSILTERRVSMRGIFAKQPPVGDIQSSASADSHKPRQRYHDMAVSPTEHRFNARLVLAE